ncbi:zinc ribbon domain-containing protein [Alkaliphilus transvaalensis]|uniref:zinc ribbon domain-containing protein n=1 Tax=Alkaliphilus transvaalensis TaxID=114628 RepID=UPI001FA72084|nr:zinc ribbon domain-containing protein [Alkaliphilus transvaalensis]
MMNICQSCGMSMKNEGLYGKNKDGSVNIDYCKYCYPNGEFNKFNETFDEMVESCIPYEVKEGFTEDEARKRLIQNLRILKRWR